MMRWSLPVLNCLVENTGSSKVTIGLSLLRRQCCHACILRPGVASKPSAFLCLLYPLPRWVSGSGPCILQVEIQSETMDRRVPRGRGRGPAECETGDFFDCRTFGPARDRNLPLEDALLPISVSLSSKAWQPCGQWAPGLNISRLLQR